VESALVAAQSPARFEWFLLVASQTYVVPSNLLALLSAHDPQQTLLLTCPRAWRRHDGGVSSFGGAGGPFHSGSNGGGGAVTEPQLLPGPALRCGLVLSRAALVALAQSTAVTPQPPQAGQALWSAAALVAAVRAAGGTFVADGGLGAAGSSSSSPSSSGGSSSSGSSSSGVGWQVAAATVGCGPAMLKGQENRMKYETGMAALKVHVERENVAPHSCTKAPTRLCSKMLPLL
jgi:uncharacterized membrane protein YgcG